MTCLLAVAATPPAFLPMLQAMSRLDMANSRATVKSSSLRAGPRGSSWGHDGQADALAAEGELLLPPPIAMATCLPLQMAADAAQQHQHGII